MRLVLHIGPSNTGATFLAEVLKQNAERLATAGWMVPHQGRPAGGASHDALAAGSSPERAQILNTILSDAGATTGIVAISTGFHDWSADIFVEVADRVGADHVDIVYMLRDPLDRFLSAWQTMVRQAHNVTLPDFFMMHFQDQAQSRLLNPVPDLRRLAELDPRFRLRIVPYEHWAHSKWGIAMPLWRDVLGMSTGYQVTRARVRQSTSLELAEFLRAVIDHVSTRHPGVLRADLQQAFATAGMPLSSFGARPDGRRVEAVFRHELRHLRQSATLNRSTHVYGMLREAIAGEFADHMVGRWGVGVVLPDGKKTIGYYDQWDIISNAAVRYMLDEKVAAVDAALNSVQLESAN